MARSPAERFWEKVDKMGPESNLGRCWKWNGTHTPDGYGLLRVGSRTDGTRTMILAHRLAYTLLIGEIPVDLESDHLCDNRGCVNPYHLNPTDHATNTLRSASPQAMNARKTHCPKGHSYDEKNTRTYPNQKGRYCRACQEMRAHRI